MSEQRDPRRAAYARAKEPGLGEEWPVEGPGPASAPGHEGERVPPASTRAGERRRRFGLGATAALLLAGAALAIPALTTDDVPPPLPRPSLSSTASASDATPGLLQDRASGTRLVFLPDDAGLAALPQTPRPMLPRTLTDVPGDPLPATGLGGGQIVAAWAAAGHVRAGVMVLLADGHRYALPGVPESGSSHAPGTVLPQRAITADGRRVFYLTDGMLIVLGVHDRALAAVRPLATVDVPVLDGAWTPGGEGIVLVGEHDRLFVDADTGRVRELTESAPGGYYELAVRDRGTDPAAVLSTWSAAAVRTGRREYAAPISAVVGPTYSSLTGWAAAAVRPRTHGLLPASTPSPQAGVLAVSGDTPDRKALLVDGSRAGSPVRCAGCVEPVGWAAGPDLLVRVRGETDQIVRWDTSTGTLWRECTLEIGDLSLAVMSPS